MGQSTTRLLKFSPEEALLIMINNHYNLNLRPEFVKIHPPQSLGGKLTEVLIEIIPSTNEVIESPYTGSFIYRYERLDLSEIQGSFCIDLQTPTTVAEVLSNISTSTGVIIDPSDFDNVAIDVESSNYILQASPSSLRWVGELSLTLGGASCYPDLLE